MNDVEDKRKADKRRSKDKKRMKRRKTKEVTSSH